MSISIFLMAVSVSGLQKSDLGIIDIDFIRKDTNESIPGMKQEKFAYDTDMEDALSKAFTTSFHRTIF